MIFILTQGPDLTIIETSSQPNFNVDAAGNYTIHTLVYDPNTLDLSTIILGLTTGLDINALLIQGGGDICGALDVNGVEIEVSQVEAQVASNQAENCGQCNGTVILTPNTNTYEWSDGGNGANRTDLCHGFYLVTATDAAGCEEILSITVEEECVCIEPVVENTVIIGATCGDSNGSATLEFATDPGNYTYNWFPNTGTTNSTGNGRTNLMAGIYSITITDPSLPNCFTIVEVAVGNQDAPQLDSLQMTPATCTAADGSITLYPDTYMYSWALDNFIGNVRSNLPAGDYNVIIIDQTAPDCPNLITITIDEASPLTAEAMINAAATCGESNGSATIAVTGGGSGNYTYSWADDPTATSDTRNDLGAGTYTVSVVDTQTGCETAVTFTMTDDVSSATIVADDQIQTSCAGVSDATLSYSVSTFPGFVLPATEIIKDANDITFTNGTLQPGNYCLVVTDGNGCVAAEHCFEVVEPDQLTLSVDPINKTCQALGSISVTAGGGTGTLMYDWADLPGTNDPASRPDLEAGTYSVTVTDVNGCSASADGLIIEDECTTTCVTPPVVDNVVIVEATCNSADGQATIQVTTDPANYNFIWNPDIGTPNAIGNQRTDLLAGTYTVRIVDQADASCFVEETFVIGTTDGPIAQLVSTTPANCIAADGGATFTPANYQYNWSDNGVGEVRTDLTSGEYFVTITDPATGCTDVQTVTIDEENNLAVTATVDSEPTCGEANGSVTIEVTNGSGSYSYSWGAGATQTNLGAGTYTVTITDDVTGCETNTTFVLQDNVAGATVTIEPDPQVSCIGDTDGTITFEVDYDNGFQQPADIRIEDANGDEVTNGSLPAGQYCVIVHDANGCLAGQACIETAEPSPIDLDVAIQDRDCSQAGTITLNVTGGNNSYSFDWADLQGADDVQDRLNLQPGVYSVTVTDANGCTAVAEDLLVDDICNPCTDPVVNNIVVIETTCNTSTGQATIEMGANPANYNYIWSPAVSTSNVAQNLAAGTYSVTIEDINDPSCAVTETITVGTVDGPVATLDETTPADCASPNGTATFSPTNFLYQWSDGQNGAIRTNLTAGTYQVTVLDQNTNCEDIVTVEIEQVNNFEVSATINAEPNCDQTDGSVTIETTNGVGPYSYSWGGNATRDDLASGVYTVSVTELATGCEGEVTFTLTDNVPAATITADDIVTLNCAGDTNGEVIYTIDLSGNFATPETVEIQNAGGQTFLNGNLAPGNYCIIVTDANGCVAGQHCFEVVEPANIELDVATTPKDCAEGGTITLTATGGTGTYTFDWADLTGSNDPQDRTDLEAGTYEVTITDENGCTASATNIFIANTCTTGCTVDAGDLTANATPVCLDANGTVTIEATPAGNATIPTGYETIYVQSINPGAVINATAQTPSFEVDAAGTYTIHTIVFDPNTFDPSTIITGTTTINDLFTQFIQGGGSICASIDINGASIVVEDCNVGCDEPEITNIVTIESKCGASDGSIDIEMVGNNADFTFAWTPAVSTNGTATDLMAGTYEVIITRASDPNCQITQTITLGNQDGPVATVQNLVPATCEAADAQITLSPNNYQYNWCDGGTGASRVDLASGICPVTVTDPATGCTDILEIDIPSQNPLLVEVSVISDANCGLADGAAEILVNNGSGAYTYVWSDGGAGALRNNLSAGSYTVTVTDLTASNCIQEVSFVIEDAVAAGAAVDIDNPIVETSCNGDTNGTVSFTVTEQPGFIQPATVEIQDGNGIVFTNGELPMGDYCIVVTDGAGCIAGQACFEVVEPSLINLDVSLEDKTCTEGGQITLVITGGTGAYTFDWSDLTGNADPGDRTDLEAGAYNVTVTDENGCTASAET